MSRPKNPNTVCHYCKTPISREPWRIRKSVVYCEGCRLTHLKSNPHLYKKIATIDYGNRYKAGRKMSKAQRKRLSESLKKAYVAGRIRIWCQGLTKDTDARVRRISLAKKGKPRPDIAGPNSNLWKGGLWSKGNPNKIDRYERRKFHQSIKKLVLKRDNYTCQLCGTQGGNLQVDHIQSWAAYVALRFELSNCRTVCMECHYLITFGKPMPHTTKLWGHTGKGGSYHK